MNFKRPFNLSNCILLSGICVTLLYFAKPAVATVLYSNLGPGDSFRPPAGYDIWQTSGGGTLDVAVPFTVTSAYDWTLDSVELPIVNRNGNNNISINLMGNATGSTGNIPGSFLSGSSIVAPPFGSPALSTATFTNPPMLMSGQTYWITASASGVSMSDWLLNNQGQIGYARKVSIHPWWPRPSFSEPAVRVNARPKVPQCVVANPGFETFEPTSGGEPNGFNDWAGDFSRIRTGSVSGITPHSGNNMLQFLGSSPNSGSPVSNASEVWQLVDVSHLATQIAAGLVTADFSYYVNRVAGDAQTDTIFSARIQAQSGSISNFPTSVSTPIGIAVNSLASDGDPNTWELVQSNMLVPVGSDYLAVRLSAFEDVFNDATSEFDGHFADSVCVRLRVVPEPGTCVLSIFGLAITFLSRKRS